jgi:hypothetical protein
MLIDTALIVKESLVGVNLPPMQPAPKSRIKLTSDQRNRLEFLLKKLRIFGELNRYHNAAYIEGLITAGEDRRAQFSPSPDCLAVVEDIVYPTEEPPARPLEAIIPPLKPVMASD